MFRPIKFRTRNEIEQDFERAWIDAERKADESFLDSKFTQQDVEWLAMMEVTL